MELFYLKESKSWNEALPIGNGFLGGMVFGGAGFERISLNEDSLWSGGRKERYNTDSSKYLPEIRKLIFEGQINKAQHLAALAMFAPNPHPAHYEPLGDLIIYSIHNRAENIKNYRRGLDLNTAVAYVSYEMDGVTYNREIFTSAVDNVMAIRFTADKPGKIDFCVDFDRDRNLDSLNPAGNNRIVASGRSIGENGVSFSSMYQLLGAGGKIDTIGASLICEAADEAVIYLCARTDRRDTEHADWCNKVLNNVMEMDYEKVKKRHIDDYQKLFNRVAINLGVGSAKDSVPTDKRLELLRSGEADNGLFALYFQFGRYLLISSSRPGSYPANLQGIWNKDMLPAWGSKYTININAEMNYWLAENCNLSELHQPLFDLIESMRDGGRETAMQMYGCRGFMAHHNTDIYGDTAPVDKCMTATIWQAGAAWLCTHIWEHYLYTKDKEFLERYYDTLKEACLFYVDFLVEDDKGRLVTVPTISPENTYILPSGESGVLCYAPSMDSQIIYTLFSAFISASSILSKDMDTEKEMAEKITEILEKIPKPEIGKHGQIMEWAEDYEEREPGHRHISHLFALYPSDQISVSKTPELAKAARVTLERRLAHGGGHTGWSRAWIINFWARLLDGGKVYENLKALLTKSTLPNLFDDHPPFQIDGNFGGTAGIAEMLMQSHSGEINILPALPDEFPDGNISGLCARGGFEVSFKWAGGLLKKLEVHSKVGGECIIKIDGKVLKEGNDRVIDMDTVKDKTYSFEF